MQTDADHLFAARYLVLAVMLGVAVAALSVSEQYAMDEAADAHVRLDAYEARIQELEARLAEVEAFVEFAKPLWPDVQETAE